MQEPNEILLAAELQGAPVPSAGAGSAWTARRFVEVLGRLGRLRIVSHCGPSTFEAICEVGGFGISKGYLNAMTPQYHWHLRLAGFGHVRSRDEIHARSGRRVFFFELRREAGTRPFLQIYLFREGGGGLEPEAAQLFADIHRDLGAGRTIILKEEA